MAASLQKLNQSEKRKTQIFKNKKGKSIDRKLYFIKYSFFKMSHGNNLWIERYVFAISNEKYSYSMIQKCDMHGITFLSAKSATLLIAKEKNSQSLLLHRNKTLK